jgi:hypothetical protein
MSVFITSFLVRTGFALKVAASFVASFPKDRAWLLWQAFGPEVLPEVALRKGSPHNTQTHGGSKRDRAGSRPELSKQDR